MEKNNENPNKPHLLILPYPGQGHINPMLQFSKRLVSKNIKTTLVTTVYIANSVHSNPNSPIKIETISDGFDNGGFSQAENEDVYLKSLQVNGSKTLVSLIKKLKDSGERIDGVVYDGFLPWALDVAKQFGLIGVVFFTQSCAVNIIYYHVQRGILPLPLTESTVSIPPLPLLKASETPSYVGSYGGYPGWTKLVFNQFSNVDEADWVLVNNFYEMEKQEVDWMAARWRLKTIGPTLPSIYMDKRLQDDKDYGINLSNPNKHTCLNWLDKTQKGSVVYVSFGSWAKVLPEQMEEIAFALKNTGYRFLWVVRSTEQAKLPQNFIEETSSKGLVVNWCPQLDVLAHESVGCFVTHCGLNSVIEALSLGVAVVAVPQWTDQLTNAKYVEDVWGIGVRCEKDEKGIARRENLEICIKQVQEGDKAKVMKENAEKWKKLAKEAVDVGGTSEKNIDEFVSYLITSSLS